MSSILKIFSCLTGGCFGGSSGAVAPSSSEHRSMPSTRAARDERSRQTTKAAAQRNHTHALGASHSSSVRIKPTAVSSEERARRRRSSSPLTRTATSESLPTLLTLGQSAHSHHQAPADRPVEIFGPNPEEHRRSSVSTATSAASDHELSAEFENMNEYLLGPLSTKLTGRKSLVLDLDETLVHSSFKYLPDADFVIPVDIEGVFHDVFVVKRPGVDEFLELVCSLYEVIVFTASVAKYGDPLLDHLDPRRHIHHRLFREACSLHNGNYVKNLAILGRPLSDIIIIDNSPASYIMQPENALPVSSWFSDMHDNELLDMLPFLRDLASGAVKDVSRILDTLIEEDLVAGGGVSASREPHIGKKESPNSEGAKKHTDSGGDELPSSAAAPVAASSELSEGTVASKASSQPDALSSSQDAQGSKTLITSAELSSNPSPSSQG